MERHSKAVARGGSIPREVKNAEPQLFHHWNRLPNEMKVMIVEKMDVKTSILFEECGWNELKLVRNHKRSSVNIRLEFSNMASFWWLEPEKMHIIVEDAISKETHLEWSICSTIWGETKIEYSIECPSFEKQERTLETHTIESATSMILRRLLTEPTFVVNELKLNLNTYNRQIDLDSISSTVCLLTVFNCVYGAPVFSIIQNMNINFKEIVGVDYEDRLMLYEHDILIYGRPRTVPAVSTFPMDRDGDYYSFLCEHSIYSHEVAYEQLKEFWNITLGLYSFVNINAVEKTLELRKTVDDIMILRAAYYYSDECIPYIRKDMGYSDRIAFLKDGIDKHLSDYQLTILSIAYLVRLFRYEPEMEKIYNLAFEDLRLVLKKFENVNLFEKLVAKLEALIP